MTVAEIDRMKETLKQMKEQVDEMLADISIVDDSHSEMESDLKDEKEKVSQLERERDDNTDFKELLSEIIEKAENWDYGLKGWRTLETKQDLIAAIKKEILEA